MSLIKIVRKHNEEYRDIIPKNNIYALPKKTYIVTVYVVGIKVWQSEFHGDVNSEHHFKEETKTNVAGF